MKAVVQDQYGSPGALRVQEVDQPLVGADEVLVRVRAASVHPDVWHVVTGRPYVLRLMGAGFRRPKDHVPGTDMAGTVEAVGPEVTRFQPGDAVFGETRRGYQWRNGGAFAEYVSAWQGALAAKPENVTFEQAAAVPTAGFITLVNLPEGWPRPGQRVLVNGAGGGVGTMAVQIAKAYGAEVTGVDHPTKLELIRSLGADHLLDYTRVDFTRAGERYDLIVDIPGNHTLSECRRALTTDGKYVLIGHDHFGAVGRRWWGSLPTFLKLMTLSPFVRHLPTPRLSTPNKWEVMATLGDLLEQGKLTPVIDRTFPLEKAAEAIEYLAGGGASGKVLIIP